MWNQEPGHSMYTASGCRSRDHTPSTFTCAGPGRLFRLFTLSILVLVLLVAVADAAEYTVRPSRNVGQEPGMSVSGETVQELDPIPLWLVLLLCVFPQLTAAPIETLLPLKAVGYLGYKRICRKNVLDSPRRLEILRFIKANPGLHFRELLREMSLTRGTLGYHVERLESAGLLKAIKSRGRCHYFATGSPYSAEKEAFIIAMGNDTLRGIITRILLNQGACTEELAEESGLSRATVYTHVKYLEHLGIVTSEREGRYVRYTLTDDYSRILTEYAHNRSSGSAGIPAEHAV
ncbi:MAG: helix-turn-helix domain-containing protein [Methanoculleus sp.]|nr:winged helix-turn-helix transcriptional regulator [Methanoculleus sp.]MCK9317130.1 helix-turn-helix domain-containing protein [Methanoculleus sp.]MDD2254619.1 helix-turn-helix domain-containing protein [Methanoculleus sp.]MDD2787837.1 helix-turn-helix domain-containing protein [Methanoculleus sp.]MDD3217130.1 helix-turn-helix domain-containing protein [Methanoculleus sp.]HOI57634.1 helix-turn-helix domain-containing protein [Methanoculleus sp.]